MCYVALVGLLLWWWCSVASLSLGWLLLLWFLLRCPSMCAVREPARSSLTTVGESIEDWYKRFYLGMIGVDGGCQVSGCTRAVRPWAVSGAGEHGEDPAAQVDLRRRGARRVRRAGELLLLLIVLLHSQHMSGVCIQYHVAEPLCAPCLIHFF